MILAPKVNALLKEYVLYIYRVGGAWLHDIRRRKKKKNLHAVHTTHRYQA